MTLPTSLHPRGLAALIAVSLVIGPTLPGRALAQEDMPDGDADMPEGEIDEPSPPPRQKPTRKDGKAGGPSRSDDDVLNGDSDDSGPPVDQKPRAPLPPDDDLPSEHSTSRDRPIVGGKEADGEDPGAERRVIEPSEPSTPPEEADDSASTWLWAGAGAGLAVLLLAGAGVGGFVLVDALRPKNGAITVVAH